jgi:hypothetical protein
VTRVEGEDAKSKSKAKAKGSWMGLQVRSNERRRVERGKWSGGQPPERWFTVAHGVDSMFLVAAGFGYAPWAT